MAIETTVKCNVLVIPREAVHTVAAKRPETILVVENRVLHRVIQTGLSDGENRVA